MKWKISHELLANSLSIFSLTAFAVSQPLFDLLSANAEFFVARQSKSIDVVLFTVFLSLLLPSVLVFLGWAIDGVSRVAGKIYYMAIITALFCLLVLLLLNRIQDLASGFVIFVATAAAAALMVLYARSHHLRRFLAFLAPSALIFGLVFLFIGDIRRIVFPGNQILTVSGYTIRNVPVIMVVFDELPLGALMNLEEQIDGLNFQNFRGVADDSVWFRNATTVAPVTNYAVPAILSGLYPDQARVPIDSVYTQNLFTVLSGSHELFSYESFTRLCPASLNRLPPSAPALVSRLVDLALDASVLYVHIVFPQSLLGSVPPIGHRWGNFLGSSEMETVANNEPASLDEVRAEMKKNRLVVFQNFIDEIQPSRHSRPAFHFLHILLPHTPWRYYPSGIVYTEERVVQIPGLGTKMDFWGDDDWMVVQGYQRYLLQLRAVDMMIGRLVEHLKSIGLYDSALFVLAADHGVSFRPGEAYRMFSKETDADIMPVPLMMKFPGQAHGRIDDRNVELIDVFPTVANLLGVKLDLPVHGHALLTPDGENNGWERGEKRMYDFFSAYEDKSIVYPARPDMVAETVRRKREIFPYDSDDSFYRMGPLADLVGRDVAPIRVGSANASVSIDQASLLEDVDIAGGFLPGLITGRIRGPGSAVQDDLWLALELNGVVVATTRTYHSQGELVFSAVLPEGTFAQGRNPLGVFSVILSNAGFELMEIGQKGGGCSLRLRDTGDEAIVYSNGETVPIVPGAVVGFVDRFESIDRTATLGGWAIAGDRKSVADFIVVTVDGECVFNGRHSGNFRPDIERHYNLPLAGYELTVPAEKMPEKKDPGVRVFGVSASGQASELAYHENLGWRVSSRQQPDAGVDRVEETRLNGTCSLETGSDGSERAVFSDIDTIPVVRGAVRGFVDHVVSDGETVRFSGWAIEGDNKSVAISLIVTIDGACVFSGPHSGTYRPDMERHYGLPNAGYDLSIPANLLVEREDLTVRLFGVSKDRRMSELAYHDWFKWRASVNAGFDE